MINNTDEQLNSLFAAARSKKIDTSSLEYGFETRLMARIREKRERKLLWSSWVWRFVPVFATIALVIGLASLLIGPESSQDLFAAVTNGYEENVMTSFLTGE